MSADPGRFPPHPVRDVEARYVVQSSCPAMVAVVTVDFEPGRGSGNGFELVIPNDVRVGFGPHGGYDDYRTVFAYLDALAEGLREELVADHQAVTDVTVVLRRVVIHPTDSNEHAFRVAGRIAARTALERTRPGKAGQARDGVRRDG